MILRIFPQHGQVRVVSVGSEIWMKDFFIVSGGLEMSSAGRVLSASAISASLSSVMFPLRR